MYVTCLQLIVRRKFAKERRLQRCAVARTTPGPEPDGGTVEPPSKQTSKAEKTGEAQS